MLGASITVGARFASQYYFRRRWTRYLTIACAVVLCILTALLVDAKLYWTAGIAGACAAAVLIALAVQYLQASRHKAEHERQQREAAARRAAAAEARTEKLDKARASAAELAKGLNTSATVLADVTMSSAASLADVTKAVRLVWPT